MDNNLHATNSTSCPLSLALNPSPGMATIDKYEHSKFLISRFDHYYDGVNNKGAFYIGLNTFVFGGICVGFLSLHDKVNTDFALWTLLLGLVVCNGLSIFFTVLAIMPFLTDNHDKMALPSLIYFGGIRKHEFGYFKEKFQKADAATLFEDLMQQIYCLATGLDKKHKKIKRASHFVVAQFILMLPLFYFILKNLKP
jgi:hypothetical protein